MKTNQTTLLPYCFCPESVTGFGSNRTCMRAETNKARLEAFMSALGERVRGPGRIYLTGGATALLRNWRSATIDIDLKADPEPAGLFEAIAELKNSLDINIELASPEDFVPALPGWRERSLYIARYGLLEFFHYDLYSQALSKLQRGHPRDLADVEAMYREGLIRSGSLAEMFRAIERQLIRYPAIDAPAFRAAVEAFCVAHPDPDER